MNRLLTLIFIAFLAGCSQLATLSPQKDVELPGPVGERVRLPNGWYLSPVGRQVDVGDGPFNLDIDPSGNYAAVTNNGAAEQSLSIVDLQAGKTTQTIPLAAAWIGIKFYSDGRKIAVSGGASNKVYLFAFGNGVATLTDSIIIGPAWSDTTKFWLGGLAIDDVRRHLYVTGRYDRTLYDVDLDSKSVIGKTTFTGMPYTCLLSNDRRTIFVSVWGDSSVAIVDAKSLAIRTAIRTGRHPNDMIQSPDGKRLYVTNGNDNTASVINLESNTVIEVLSSALFTDAPPGSTPNSVALSADGKTLYIANADNNYLAAMDVGRIGSSASLGFIPTGWYPSVVRLNPRTGDLVVANAKGGSSAPNPRGPRPGHKAPPDQYSGSMFHGTLSLIDKSISGRIAETTRRVYENSLLKGAGGTFTQFPDQSPIPLKPGDTSPIKHVFYIIKENRTYDQVFGDIKEGNGDSTLTIFGEQVTPNLHALVHQFVLLDNIYVDAEVSADGHNWSDAAYASDFVEKSWPTLYGGFGGDFDYEADNPVARPGGGYIWDNCARAGLSWRNYGEFMHMGSTPAEPETAEVAAQVGHADTLYRGWDMAYSDIDRIKEWTREFDEFERNGNLPRFNIFALPNDHTEGTRKGSRTPQAFVAQNDQAVGMLVDRISHSKYWKESAIFIIEDDAQAGSDHVDAHRVEALVISPWTRHHAVDHTMYSTSSMVRTMELILGLPPMTQFDAAATPMLNSFSPTMDASTYTLVPPKIDIEAKNIAGAYGQQESNEMNFTRMDATPEIRLNEIIWKSIRGTASIMPAPVRSAFVKVHSGGDEDDND